MEVIESMRIDKGANWLQVLCDTDTSFTFKCEELDEGGRDMGNQADQGKKWSVFIGFLALPAR